MDSEVIRLWRDPMLGVAGTEMLVAHGVQRTGRPQIRDEVVIAVLTGGALRHCVGGREGVARAGAVLVVPAGEPFCAEAATDQGWSWRVFYPDVRTITQVEALASPPLPVSPGPLYDDVALARRLAILHRAIEANDDNPPARQQAFAGALSEMLQRIARPAGWPRSVRAGSGPIRRALECVHARFADPELSVSALAAAAGYSEYHFMRTFRAIMGVTAHDYVVQCRLHAARAMLADGIPAAEVAFSSGFSDQSHLIRQFRAAHGVTPGQYAEDSRRRSASRLTQAGVRRTAQTRD